MDFTLEFIKVFFIVLGYVYPLLCMMLLAIVIMGLVVGQYEGWTRFDSVYWTFITALTVGYGDIRPVRKISRVLAILIAWLGIMFSGIIVAITLHAVSVVVKGVTNV